MIEMNRTKSVFNSTIAFLFVFLLFGCSSSLDVIKAKGTGLYRVYPKPYDTVWNAALKIIDESSLSIVSQDKERGEIVAKTGFQLFVSMGENVAVFVAVDTVSHVTGVEVVAKKAMSTNVFAKDWGPFLINKFDERLKQ
jgi:hypothetical protein